ncbi:MAG: hypothetical protein ACI9SE_003509 [Neolewinella sp.]|jgi:hypothetical protein
MRAILAVFAILILSGAAYWALQDDGAGVAPPSNDEENEAQQPRGKAGPAHADRAQVVMQPPAKANASPSNGTPNNQSPSQAEISVVAIPFPTVALTVRDIVTRQAIETFRWRFVQPRSMQRGESTSSVVELALPRRAIGDLLVEAEGMQPFTKKQFAIPAENEPKLLLEVFLTPVATAAGITLLVKRLDNQPVADVRVDAFEIDAAKRDTAWQLGQPLWSRRTAAEDGIYQLPPLPPGEYGILLVATSPEGELLPLLPFRRTFVLNGSNGFLEDVPLEEACALQLQLLEINRQPFNPKDHGNVTISLNQPGQTGLQRKWTTNATPNATGQVTTKITGTISEANRVPGPGLIWLDEPIAPGRYLLEIFINGDPRVSQTLLLRHNERQLETIYVR